MYYVVFFVLAALIFSYIKKKRYLNTEFNPEQYQALKNFKTHLKTIELLEPKRKFIPIDLNRQFSHRFKTHQVLNLDATKISELILYIESNLSSERITNNDFERFIKHIKRDLLKS